MAYLQPSEYAAYGLGADTSDAWVLAASSMIEAHCRRSSLLSTSYTERLRVNRQWGTARLTYGPAVQLVSAQARYCPHFERSCDTLFEYALVFGLPGQWVALDPTTITVDTTGEVQLPLNFLGLQYSELEVTYTAGLTTTPDAVKFACAQIVKNAQATPGLNVKSSRLDTLQTQYFSDSLMDSQVRALLRPFVAERMG